MPTWRGNTYRFTVTSANATVGATYINNSQTFTVTSTIAAGTVLFCTGTGAPTAAGTLTKATGTGDAAIVFSANVAPNVNWGTATNWDTGAVPTNATDAIFDNASLACTVNVTAVCANLNFNSGTGYASTITMTNFITVGLTNPTTLTNTAVTLSSAMTILGSGSIATRSLNTGTLTLRSNGKRWPNPFGISNVTAATGTAGLVAIADNWTIGGGLFIGTGTGYTATFSGAFTITCETDLSINVLNATQTSRIAATAGSITTIALTGTGTWSCLNPVNFGLNLIINAPGQTVTIGDNCSYGGNGCQSGSSFTYVAGTVVTLGTFYLNFYPSAAAGYTVNLSGSSSTSATTTSTTGINFNNLTLRTNVTSAAQTCTVTGTLCVVNDLTVSSVYTTSKSIFILSGGTLYANKNFTVNGYSNSNSSTTIRLQGTGTWTENNTLSSAGISWGVGNSVVIAGNITLGSFVGVTTGTLTYTSGTFVTTSYGLRLALMTIAGFGAAGIKIETIYHTTAGATASASATITITDSSPLLIGSLILNGFNGNWSHRYLGTAGWTCDSLNYQQTSSASGCDITLNTGTGITYKVNTSLILRAWTNSTNSLMLRNGVPRAVFTLMPGASQDVYYMGGNSIDSSAGQTIWSRKGSLTSTLNWNLWTYPKTRFSSFTS